jgi:hypothetical protein
MDIAEPSHSSDDASDTDSDSPDELEQEEEEQTPDHHIDVDEKYIVSFACS